MIVITVHIRICRVTGTMVGRPPLRYAPIILFLFFFLSPFFLFFFSHYSAAHCVYDIQKYGGRNSPNAGWLFCTARKQKDIRAKGKSPVRGARKPQDGEKITTKANNKINVKYVRLYYGQTKTKKNYQVYSSWPNLTEITHNERTPHTYRNGFIFCRAQSGRHKYFLCKSKKK